MAKYNNVFIKIKTTQLFVAVAIILLISSVGFFLYRYYVSNKQNNYLVENKYYGFKLKTPENWVAKEKTFYSEDNITKILQECKNDKSNSASVYEIGAFRFENQRYPEDFGDPGYFPSGLSSGVILDVKVNCIPQGIKNKIINSEEFLNLSGFGKTKQIYFLHNNFQYKISELVYISPNDKKNEEKLRQDYVILSDKIISSFNFVK